MPKSSSNVFTNKAFEKSKQRNHGFNIVSQTNNFNSVFNTQPLDESESNKIEKLLAENFIPESIEESQVEQNSTQLKQITAEIKAIGRQGVVLIGERVAIAKNILKPYKDGTFTKWLESTFGVAKTGYNALSYFELYKLLPQQQLKENFKKIPLRAAYILASRGGSLETKSEIIEKYYNYKHNDLVTIIKERIPIPSKDRRTKKSSTECLITQMLDIAKKIETRKDCLTNADKDKMSEILKILKLISS